MCDHTDSYYAVGLFTGLLYSTGIKDFVAYVVDWKGLCFVRRVTVSFSSAECVFFLRAMISPH